MFNVITYEFDKGEQIRYPSIILFNNKEYIFFNKGKNVNQETKLLVNNKIHNIFDNLDEISHNFSIFQDKNKKIFYGIGGQYKRQNPYIQNYKKICKEKNINFWNCNNKGLYLLKSSDLLEWSFVQEDPIITHDNEISNYTIGIEKKFPCFDSNLCCFYSKLFKKYLLFCRANIKPGVRSIQVITSRDLINWSDFTLIKLNTFNDECHNLYMNKIIELEDKKLLLGLSVFTDHNKEVKDSHIKIMVSADYKNWKDCGKLLDIPVRKKCKRELKGHATIHIIGMLREKNIITVYLQKNYTLDNQYIVRYDFQLDILLKNWYV